MPSTPSSLAPLVAALFFGVSLSGCFAAVTINPYPFNPLLQANECCPPSSSFPHLRLKCMMSRLMFTCCCTEGIKVNNAQPFSSKLGHVLVAALNDRLVKSLFVDTPNEVALSTERLKAKITNKSRKSFGSGVHGKNICIIATIHICVCVCVDTLPEFVVAPNSAPTSTFPPLAQLIRSAAQFTAELYGTKNKINGCVKRELHHIEIFQIIMIKKKLTYALSFTFPPKTCCQ